MNLKCNKKLFFVIVLSLCIEGCIFIPSRYKELKTYIVSIPEYQQDNIRENIGNKKIYVESGLRIHDNHTGREKSIISNLDTYLISKGFISAQKEEADLIIKISSGEEESGIATPDFLGIFNSYGYTIIKFAVTFLKKGNIFIKEYKAIQRVVYDRDCDYDEMFTKLVQRLGEDIYKFTTNEKF